MNHESSDASRWVDLYADALYAYAFRMIPNADAAQDLVQETFIAALKNRRTFEGRSKERTWLIGILRNKIFDHLRRKYKSEPLLGDIPDDQIGPDTLYDPRTGALKSAPSSWQILPSEIIEKEDFWKAFYECLGKLPRKGAESFSLREVEQASTEEICHILNISATHLGVLLHRARVFLRQCLESNWFKDHD